MAATATDEAPPVKKGPGLVIQIAVLLVMTGVAVGGGWVAGGTLRSETPEAAEQKTPTPVKPAHGEAGGHGEAKDAGHGAAPAAAGGPLIVPLAPITTNIAQPADTWLRMELAVVYDKAPEDPGLTDTIHQDILAYIRTIKMHQMEGPSGFLHLKADLDERAAIRSDGLAKKVLVRTMILE